MLKFIIYTFLLSLTPVVELRGSIPISYLKFNLPINLATTISILGGVCIAIILPWILPIVAKFLEKYIPLLHNFLNWHFKRTQSKHSYKLKIFGDIILITIVAIPLPGTGAWTGSILAYLFHIPYKKAIILISIGVIISGITVALLTVSGKEIWQWINESV